MAGSRIPGPIGAGELHPDLDAGTLPRMAMPAPGSTGQLPVAAAAPDATTDPEIEALELAPLARAAAYALKRAHPQVRFTSGRRDKADQARAMASNVAKEGQRRWIEETYKASPLRTRCQDWLDAHPEVVTAAGIAAGLLAIFDAAGDRELSRLSRHLAGMAFDVQPVEHDAEAIKTTIRGLPGLDLFLDREGGLVRWHAQF